MHKPNLLVLIFIFLISGLQLPAQQLMKLDKTNYIRCYTVEQMTAHRKMNPGAETDAQFESWLGQKNKLRKADPFRPANTNYTIPVIFHIVHNGEISGTSPNLPASLINAQILQLNKDFANATNSPYPAAAATGLQFVLAQTDPIGLTLSEPGINRIDRNLKGWTDYNTGGGWTPSYIDGTVKPSSTWNSNNYYNVWIIPELNTGTTDILGYASFPSSSNLQGLNNFETASTAGVVILTATVGSTFLPGNCNFAYGLGKTLAHETGHFMGLRHIWGDSDCGTDYCNDTPVHFDANSGVPSHPKSNSCGTPDEMFENYMDYSNDIILNTITTNQVDRIQTVMLNSPRRLSLSTSTVGGVPAVGTNRISFINCNGTLAVTESGENTTYPRFRDVSLTLNVEDKATANATVTVNTAGTAINGTHYQLLTPSLNFVAGDHYKPVILRIFDNAIVDGDRTIIVSYSIAGTGVTAGPTAQLVTINLQDDDNMRVGETTINLLDEHFDNPAGTFGLPSGWGLLTTSAYPNPFVASINGDAGGTGPCAHITNNVTSKPNFYTQGVAGAAVLQSPVIDATAVQSLGNLSFTYKTRGLVDQDQAYLTYNVSTSTTGPFYFYGNTSGLLGNGPYSSNDATITNTPVIAAPANLVSRKFNLSFYWETGTLATGASPGFNVDDIVLVATPYRVETNTSSSYTYDVSAGAGIHNFKSAANRAIATITNLSQNVAALSAKITAAGSGTTGVTTNTGNFLRTQKVFQVSPVTPNSTVTYRATFYFTIAELAVWGADRLNLKILKVQDGVLLDGVLNGGNAAIITPTVMEDVAGGYISYSADFTGFSQFMLVSPLASLPVNLTSFEATARQKDIQLVWNTSREINNRGFIVERSLDATNFKQVGWVNGNGTTSIASTYNFTDNFVQRNITYYYRIRQVDIDNRQQYSPVKNARLKQAEGITITVSPNPVKSEANIFIVGTQNRATIELINASGQKLLQRNDVNATNGLYKLNLGHISKGVYTLVVNLPEGIFTKQIIIQ